MDWPWACIGAAWFDQLLLCVNVDLYGGYDPEKLVRHYLASVNRDDITAALAGLCWIFHRCGPPAARPGPSHRARFSTRTNPLHTELAAQALPKVNHNQRTPEMGCIRAPTWCRHAFRQEHVTCTATPCETKPTPRCLSAEFGVEDA